MFRLIESTISLGSEVIRHYLLSMSCEHQIQMLSMASIFSCNRKTNRIFLSPSKAPVAPIFSAYRKIPPKMSTSIFPCLRLYRLRIAKQSPLFPHTPISYQA